MVTEKATERGLESAPKGKEESVGKGRDSESLAKIKQGRRTVGRGEQAVFVLPV